ncbi:MAG TPA: phosphatase PAP2 family protein, partial [Lacipirellulaceae bacterium]|nr:phosphatase PAP2 family protein [Lacipirellulaceae bacterium]
LLLGLAAMPPLWPRASARVLAALTVRAGFLFLAIGAPGLLTLAIKQLFGRARPYVAEGAPYLLHPFALRSEYASFPSGHSTTAFAAAAAIGALWPRAGIVTWAYALVIASSRVVVTAHFPSDVIGSAIVGVLGAMMVRNYFATRRLAFGIQPDGTVHAFAGPSYRRIKRLAVDLSAQWTRRT